MVKVYCDGEISVFCADGSEAFFPYPSKNVLPEEKICKNFKLCCAKDDVTAFQLIVSSEKDLTVESVNAAGLCCINLGGVDVYGKEFTKKQSVEAGKPAPLWCLIDGCEEKKSLWVSVVFTDKSDDKQKSIAFEMEVRPEEAGDALYTNKYMSRLKWLNSKAGISQSITKDFEPIGVTGRRIDILGRQITVAENGFIESISTAFEGINDVIGTSYREMLSAPIEYEITENGKRLSFDWEGLTVLSHTEESTSWSCRGVCGDITAEVFGSADFDGSAKLWIELSSESERNINVKLVYSQTEEFSRYFMGLGLTGCKTPESHTWKWDSEKRQNSLWCGNVNGGIFVRPTDKGVTRPFVNIYYHHSTNHMPDQWVNDGKGIFTLKKDKGASICFDSGEFLLSGTVELGADIMVSPFKKTDLKKHWKTHYYHKNFNTPYGEDDIKDALENGCTHINVHHGNDTLPFLNYPMYDCDTLKSFIDAAHAKGLKVKPYYTVRELTTRLPELAAFRSLGDEIFPKPTYDQGGVAFHNGVDPHLTEVFGSDVIPAWKHSFEGGKYNGTTDPTVVTNGQSRISNFFVGSAQWLAQKLGIDGLYIDDCAIDGTTMRRLRRVLEENVPDVSIDFHTCNHFQDSREYGFGYGHNMLMYMELLPYINSLWVGEGFEYDEKSPEFLLLEISGIPFGLMGEMLEGDCNPFKGMLYGMTARYPYYRWYTSPSPVPVWKAREGFEGGVMSGFWNNEQCVETDNPKVLCTAYSEGGKVMYCFANFSKEEEEFSFCAEGGFSRMYAPEIEGIQCFEEIDLKDLRFKLKAHGGIMIIAE